MINNMNHITISAKVTDASFNFYKNILYLKSAMKSDISSYFLSSKI